MSELLSRLIQLRYEYFNYLSFEDLDEIIGELPCSTSVSSDDLIKTMREFSMKRYPVNKDKIFNIRTAVSLVTNSKHYADTLEEAKVKAYEDIKTLLRTVNIQIGKSDIEQGEV